MTKKGRRRRYGFGGLINFVVWLVGVLVALAVGFGMVDGVLRIWFLPQIITIIAGWIVVIFTFLGALFRIFGAFK
jgi:hypothetical protein